MSDSESRSHADQHAALRLWLRLLSCSKGIEGRVSQALRARFDTSLPRFDLLAQLERHPEGLRMRELSARLMVTGGNITGLTDQLEAEGWVERLAVPGDRRVSLVRLTRTGRSQFARMAKAHEGWIVALFAKLDADEQRALHQLLGKLKSSVANAHPVSPA